MGLFDIFRKKKSSKKKKKSNHKQKNTKKTVSKVIPPSIKDNPWNVHYVNNNTHAQIIITAKNKEALTLGTTTESKDKDPKIPLNDGLTNNQNEPSFVKTHAKVIPTKRIQRKKKNSRITPKDKNLIYEEIKNIPSNVEKYDNLGSLIPEEQKK